MIGNGLNQKSMAYVGNLVDFILWSITESSESSVTNYVDQPDLSMNELVSFTRGILNLMPESHVRVPFCLGLLGGYCFDLMSKLTGSRFAISSIRIRKFCATTSFSSNAKRMGFKPKQTLKTALAETITREFIYKDCQVEFETE